MRNLRQTLPATGQVLPDAPDVGAMASEAVAVDPALPLPRRRKASFFSRSWPRTVLSIALGLAIWQIVALNTSSLVMAPLGSIWSAFTSTVADGSLWVNLSSTLTAFAIGFVIASLAGIVIGLVMASSKIIFDLFDPWVSALRSTPLITIAPLFIVAFGITLGAKIAVVVLVAVFPVIINTADGVRTTDRGLIETAYAFGTSPFRVFTKILLPAALPFIISGLRLAVNMALVGVVVAEFFGSRAGIGFMIFQAAQLFDTGTVFLGVLILAIIGTVLTKLMYLLEGKLAPWRKFQLESMRGA